MMTEQRLVVRKNKDRIERVMYSSESRANLGRGAWLMRYSRLLLTQIQLKMKHPNRTGLVLRNGIFTKAHEPFYLKDIEVLYGGERVSHFDMTSALSDDPLITFPLRARHDGPLRVILMNNKGHRSEATHDIHFS